MRIEIDQSGKVEETNKDTVLAFADHVEYSILLSSLVKKQFLETLRRQKENDKAIYLKLFTIGLFILLRNYLEDVKYIFIDIEYPGKETYIKTRLQNFFVKKKTSSEIDINFTNIGKSSSAHEVAWSVTRKLRKPNWIVKFTELLIYSKEIY